MALHCRPMNFCALLDNVKESPLVLYKPIVASQLQAQNRFGVQREQQRTALDKESFCDLIVSIGLRKPRED
jgi:hypothetical protein